ncbi:MAG: hypothetical protein ACOX0A_07490 [Thermoguttaceae bacterium]
MKKKTFFALAILCLCSVVVVGCNKGPKKVPITGSVKVGDEVVESGHIKFDPVDGQGPSDGATITDGTFSTSVTTGEKKVTVYGTKVVGTFEPDPVLNPGVTANKYEDYPPQTFAEEKTVTIEKKNQVVDIQYAGEEE